MRKRNARRLTIEYVSTESRGKYNSTPKVNNVTHFFLRCSKIGDKFRTDNEFYSSTYFMKSSWFSHCSMCRRLKWLGVPVKEKDYHKWQNSDKLYWAIVWHGLLWGNKRGNSSEQKFVQGLGYGMTIDIQKMNITAFSREEEWERSPTHIEMSHDSTRMRDFLGQWSPKGNSSELCYKHKLHLINAK
jgi:hypothetical protein